MISVHLDAELGHLWVEHDGSIGFDHLMAIKAAVWGRDVRAIEVYPAADELVDTRPIRHLWRLGDHEFCPDLLGRSRAADTLQSRFARAWAEAGE